MPEASLISRPVLLGSKAKSFDGLTALLGRGSIGGQEGRYRVARVQEEEERRNKVAKEEEEKKKREEQEKAEVKEDKPTAPRRRGRFPGISVSR